MEAELTSRWQAVKIAIYLLRHFTEDRIAVPELFVLGFVCGEDSFVIHVLSNFLISERLLVWHEVGLRLVVFQVAHVYHDFRLVFCVFPYDSVASVAKFRWVEL